MIKSEVSQHLLNNDPAMIFQHVTAAVLQVNQAIEANIVRPELPEEADRVEQLLVIIISFY